MGHRNKNGSVDKYWGKLKQKHKKTAFWRCQCFAPVVSAAVCLISSRGLNQPPTPLTPPSPARAVASPKGLKPLAFDEKPLFINLNLR